MEKREKKKSGAAEHSKVNYLLFIIFYLLFSKSFIIILRTNLCLIISNAAINSILYLYFTDQHSQKVVITPLLRIISVSEKLFALN